MDEGTAYKRVEASADLLVVGAYPKGQEGSDTLRGDDGDVEQLRRRIAAMELPEKG